jgi:hypothetical protein
MGTRVCVGAILAAILGLAVTPSYAQSVSGGVKVGVNFAKISVDPDDGEDFKNKTGFLGGAFVDFPVSEGLSIQPEFLYSMKGAKLGEDDGSEFEIEVNVVQIPVLLKVNFGASRTRPFLVFGPAFGFPATAKIKSGDLEEDIKDDLASVDFSGVIGFGVQFGNGMLEARYDHGFTDMDEADDESSAKTRTFSILFGIGFGR